MAEALTLLDRLSKLSYNLLWSWQPEVQELFREIDPDLWEATNHNPVAFLNKMPPAEVEKRGSEAYLNTRILYAYRRMEEYLSSAGPLGGSAAGSLNVAPVAYFSAEFGLHESLPIYSGGLGILAGDHLKSASDLGVPLVGVGLMYTQGYFHQRLNRDGWQEESYESNTFEVLPCRPALGPDGKPVEVVLEMPGHPLHVKVWRIAVGRVTLFLLDTDVPKNSDEDRRLTDRLYGGDNRIRIRQEIVLGVGGLRALRAVGVRPGVLHLNEGHCAFAVLERMRERVQEDGLPLQAAREETLLQTCFTTHTPVPAGHDRFDQGLMEENLGWLRQNLGLSVDDFMALGRVNPSDPGENFTMTVLALKVSSKRNAVANLHGKVSRAMWHPLWPDRPLEEVPIGHITNGVHVASWLAPVMQRQYEKLLGRNWAENMRYLEIWQNIQMMDDGELWETHLLLKQNLVRFVRHRLAAQAALRGEILPQPDRFLDPGALTIGFSRRFATYKRATLLLDQPDRLLKLINDPVRPIQFIFAGKAHPRDDGGKSLIQHISQLARDPRFHGRLVFVEDYDIGVARTLVQGVDVWLNNPERPLEACGTSGMKVLLNGGLNFSVLDGWWAEAYDGSNGFAIGNGLIHRDGGVQRQRDAADLYETLEQVIIPRFFDRGADGLPRAWLFNMKRTIASLGWRFSAARMMSDYMRECYLPASGATSCDMGSQENLVVANRRRN
jgi:starch phosphorylase